MCRALRTAFLHESDGRTHQSRVLHEEFCRVTYCGNYAVKGKKCFYRSNGKYFEAR